MQISVFSKRIEDLEEFMDALEKTGAFSGVLSRSDQPDEDGTLRSELQAYYTPVDGRPAPPATSESGKGAAGEPERAGERQRRERRDEGALHVRRRRSGRRA